MPPAAHGFSDAERRNFLRAEDRRATLRPNAGEMEPRCLECLRALQSRS